MRRIHLLFAATAALTVFTACPPTYPKCNSDENCTEKGEVCVQGQCQECQNDANCKTGFVCQDFKCVPKPECTPAGNECGTGEKCKAGKCVVHECDSNADCQGGRCENNRCVSGCTEDADCPSGQKCENSQCVTAVVDEQCSWEPVRFEFNEAGLTDDARTRLEQIADCIKKENARVTLEGHADERGTEEYNLQLSNRRAESVKKYLTTLGVSGGQLDTVGFGENRPASGGSGEDAWAANRRVEFNRR